MASIQHKADQLSFKGRGPLDAKATVKTYSDLINLATWTVDDTLVAYNGMIVAVWLDKTNASNNGIYYLFDPLVTSAIKKPDVTNEDNWHRLGGLDDLQALAGQIDTIKESLEELQDSSTEVVELKEQLPEIGAAGKLYVVTEEATTYIWHNSEYLPVGDGGGEDSVDIQLINGGSPEN